jgi:streptomycin 6-kinase
MSPAAREIAIRRWSLELGEPLSGGHRSDVHAVRRPGGFAAVLKVCASTRDAADEAAALSAWAPSEVAVRLLDADLRAGALLLERLVPGTPLPAGDSGPATDVLAALHGTPLPEYAFRELAGSFPDHEREVRADLTHERRARSEPDRAREAERLLPSAGRLMEGLATSAPRRVLLHGDFLNKNLLGAGDGYRVVDPIPRLGDPAADAGMFAHDRPAPAILDTASELAGTLGLDLDRTVAWAVVWTVMVTVQAWRDDQADLDALVVSPTFQRLLGD